MKVLKKITLIFLGLVIFACSTDDDGGTATLTQSEPLTGDYFPNALSNLWIYNVVNTNPEDATLDFTEVESLTISSSTGSNYTLSANNTPALGTMNGFLVNGTLTSTDDTLIYNGSISTPDVISELFNTSISLDNVLLYSLNADDNEELSTKSGTITQDLDLNGTIVPLTLNYSFSTTKLASSNSLTLDGETFSDVIKSNLRLNVDVTVTINAFGQQLNISVLDSQDIMSIDYYFAKDKGLIKANATQGYEISSSFVMLLEGQNIDIGIPTTASSTNNQEIDSYILN
ncbi:hypothetical protein [Lacinutrix sp. Bg11-31]|uniref:hypothetical protein n=1 Tax=Lacinutrix sp. Bg11-31 TaxID=2057808 RepID=UPI000C30D168|nr:hypothetical protein [Lacinutrix sp. Bg11-31]AUC81533.1 hypothetical protein CW733_05050 [Lacinutrix sp. Bg11-31]